MAILFSVAGQGLSRTIGTFLSTASDFTVMCWGKFVTDTPAAGRFRTFFQISNAGATRFFFLGSDLGVNKVILSVGNGITTLQVNGPTLVLGRWYHVAATYTAATKACELIVDDVSQGTVTVDLSAVTFTQQEMGDEGTPSWPNTAVEYYRDWQSKLTLAQIQTESQSRPAVIAAFTDTQIYEPSQLRDASGNGHAWTKVGAVSFTDPGPLAQGAASFLNNSVFVTPDPNFHTAVLIDAASGARLATLDSTITGEAGSILPDGVFCGLSAANGTLELYNANLTYNQSVSPFGAGVTWNRGSPIGNDRKTTFYVGRFQVGVAMQMRTVTETGTLGATTFTLATTTTNALDLGAMCPSADGTILYYSWNVAGQPIKRWDLVGNVALSDFLAAPGNTIYGANILLLPSGNLLLLSNANITDATVPWKAVQYTPAAAIVQTVTLPVGSDNGSAIEIALDQGNSNAFWTRTYPTVASDVSRWTNWNLTTGTQIATFLVTNGEGDPPAAGLVPNSCPFFAKTAVANSTGCPSIARGAQDVAGDPVGGTGPYGMTVSTILECEPTSAASSDAAGGPIGGTGVYGIVASAIAQCEPSSIPAADAAGAPIGGSGPYGIF